MTRGQITFRLDPCIEARIRELVAEGEFRTVSDFVNLAILQKFEFDRIPVDGGMIGSDRSTGSSTRRGGASGSGKRCWRRWAGNRADTGRGCRTASSSPCYRGQFAEHTPGERGRRPVSRRQPGLRRRGPPDSVDEATPVCSQCEHGRRHGGDCLPSPAMDWEGASITGAYRRRTYR